MTELTVAIALLAGALLPLAYSIAKEHQLARGTYQRAIAMEIVDGELEFLAAGSGRGLPAGTQPYQVQAAAATNLPPGEFILTVGPDRLQLAWRPKVADHGGSVLREVRLK